MIGVVCIIREQRIQAILNTIKTKGVVSIEELTTSLNTSRSTIRRDLRDLEDEHELKCTRGGAMSIVHKTSYEPPFDVRKDRFLDEKERIALAAFKLIQENETVILSSGTTVYEVAKLIKDFEHLYIATNDLNSAMTLSSVQNIDLIVLGGMLRQSHYSLNGLFTESTLTQMHADRVFLGVDAVDFNIGFMNFSIEEIQTKRLMIQASHEVVVLCDHSKFERIAFANICPFEDVDLIITGKEIGSENLNKLEELGVKVITV